MGRDADGKYFCDNCHKPDGKDMPVDRVYLCEVCKLKSNKAPYLCGSCILVHWRRSHPREWMKYLAPLLKKRRDDGRRD